MFARSILSTVVLTSILANVACGSSNDAGDDIGAAEGNISGSSVVVTGDYHLTDRVNVASLSISRKTDSSLDFRLVGRAFEGDLKAQGPIEISGTADADRPGHYAIADERSKCVFTFGFSSSALTVSVSGVWWERYSSCALRGFGGTYAKNGQNDRDTAPAVAVGEYGLGERKHLVVLGVDGLGRLNFQLELTSSEGTTGMLGDPPLDPAAGPAAGEFEKADYDRSKRVWQYKGLNFKYDSSNDQYSFTIDGAIEDVSLLNGLEPKGTYKASNLWD